ncbi:hypothetical protein C1632_02550 [Microbacterium testaceum]|uniref:hypothetical protein n=1 Tax=Microbacterium testaceum TaxID=2033 RepID=UPI000CCE4141|nr:hypothetical protein [Microbacterium testaceum]PNW10659.1 hypothetical protein C1632_02550 [Microbacterium testaceum]
MRILTVRQPWAWAIIHGGKDVENRVRNIAGDYRGPVAIHVGLDYDTAWSSPAMFEAMKASGAHSRPGEYPWHEDHGAIIGVVNLWAVHPDRDNGSCCPRRPARDHEWGERGVWHLCLSNPSPLAEPIPYRGALGLRRLDDDMTARILAQIGETA